MPNLSFSWGLCTCDTLYQGWLLFNLSCSVSAFGLILAHIFPSQICLSCYLGQKHNTLPISLVPSLHCIHTAHHYLFFTVCFIHPSPPDPTPHFSLEVRDSTNQSNPCKSIFATYPVSRPGQPLVSSYGMSGRISQCWGCPTEPLPYPASTPHTGAPEWETGWAENVGQCCLSGPGGLMPVRLLFCVYSTYCASCRQGQEQKLGWAS